METQAMELLCPFSNLNHSPTTMDPFKCGGCEAEFGTICQLHEHLLVMGSSQQLGDECPISCRKPGGSYHYDHVLRTAFPRYDSVCTAVQTDLVLKATRFRDISGNFVKPKSVCENSEKRSKVLQVKLKYKPFRSGNAKMTKADINSEFKVPNEVLIRNCSVQAEKLDFQNNSDDLLSFQTNDYQRCDLLGTDSSLSDSIKLDTHIYNYMYDSKLDNSDTHTCSAGENDNDGYTAISDEFHTDNNSIVKSTTNGILDMMKCSNQSFNSSSGGGVTLHNSEDGDSIPLLTPDIKKDVDAILLPSHDGASDMKTENLDELYTNIAKQTKTKVRQMGHLHKTEPHILASSEAEPMIVQADTTTRRKKVPKAPFVCELCGVSVARYEAADHMRKHTGDCPFVCHICAKAFSSKRCLNKHVKCHLRLPNTGKHACDMCKYATDSRQALKLHQQSHTGHKLFPCRMCDKSYAASKSLTIHMDTIHLGVKKYKCDLCNEAFFALRYMQRHKMLHHLRPTLMCRHCGKAFAIKNSLLRHERTHMNANQLQCHICTKTFNVQWNLDCHLRTHSEARLVCDICGVKFKQPTSLKRHMHLHTGKKFFHCHICDHGFIQCVPYYKHMLKIHSISKAECVEKLKKIKKKGSPDMDRKEMEN